MDLIFAWELGLRKIILESDFPGGYAGFSKLHHSSGFHPTADHSCKIFAAELHPHREGSNGYIWLYNWVKESPPIIASQIISDVVVLGLNPVQWNLIYFPSKKKKKKEIQEGKFNSKFFEWKTETI